MAEQAKTRMAWGTLTADAIVDAALRLIEDDGMDALSIRRLAEELGVGRMSLYRHVDSKDALLRLVVGAVAERELLGAAQPELPWQEELAEAARQIRAQLTRYPGLGRLLLTAGSLGPESRRFADRLLGIFRRAGFADEDVAVCYLIFVDTVLGRVHRETAGDFASNERMRSFTEGDGSAQTPVLRQIGPLLSTIPPETVFEDMLEVMIAGFTARLEAAP